MTWRFLSQCNGQRGAISPFMFGLIVGMSIFSMASLQWAKQELARQQARNAAKDQAQAKDVAQAIQFSMLAETHDSYSDDINMKEAMGYTTVATGKTRGGEKVMVAVQNVDSKGSFGAGTQRVGITASDDILRRSQLNRAGSADELNKIAGQSDTTVVTFDTSSVRAKQMKDSVSALEGLAEQIYAFYAGHLRFPNGSEFDKLAAQFDYHDVWGRKFEYEMTDNDNATLAFTTPWNFNYTQRLNLRDNNNQQQVEDVPPVSPSTVSSTGL